MPEPIASLLEADTNTTVFTRSDAKVVPSKRPGYIAVEIEHGVQTSVSYEDESLDALRDNGTIYRESVEKRQVQTCVVYVPTSDCLAAAIIETCGDNSWNGLVRRAPFV